MLESQSQAPLASKGELRRQFKNLRDGLPPERRLAWSSQICEHLAAYCSAANIRSVGAFAPFLSEVDLGALEFSNPHLAFCFPRVASLDPPRLAWGPRPLEPGRWGLLEPAIAPHAVPPVQLLLVPGLAFAEDGHRLGYGKGFYDSVLAALPTTTVALAVGFSVQRCERLPASPRDCPVQGLATEEGITWIA